MKLKIINATVKNLPGAEKLLQDAITKRDILTGPYIEAKAQIRVEEMKLPIIDRDIKEYQETLTDLKKDIEKGLGTQSGGRPTLSDLSKVVQPAQYLHYVPSQRYYIKYDRKSSRGRGRRRH